MQRQGMAVRARHVHSLYGLRQLLHGRATCHDGARAVAGCAPQELSELLPALMASLANLPYWMGADRSAMLRAIGARAMRSERVRSSGRAVATVAGHSHTNARSSRSERTSERDSRHVSGEGHLSRGIARRMHASRRKGAEHARGTPPHFTTLTRRRNADRPYHAPPPLADAPWLRRHTSIDRRRLPKRC